MKTSKSKKAKEVFETILGHVSFGEMLASLRECDDISHKDFAAKLGISKQEL